MLPTEKGRVSLTDGHLMAHSHEVWARKMDIGRVMMKHLYVTIDDKPIDGDWVSNGITIGRYQARPDGFNIRPRNGGVIPCPHDYEIRKVIASTDKYLKVRGIDMDFIKTYCENPVEDVLVEYEVYQERYFYSGRGHGESDNERRRPTETLILKVTPEDTINITTIKKEWTRGDVSLLLMDTALEFGVLNPPKDDGTTGEQINDWIKKRLP